MGSCCSKNHKLSSSKKKQSKGKKPNPYKTEKEMPLSHQNSLKSHEIQINIAKSTQNNSNSNSNSNKDVKANEESHHSDNNSPVKNVDIKPELRADSDSSKHPNSSNMQPLKIKEIFTELSTEIKKMPPDMCKVQSHLKEIDKNVIAKNLLNQEASEQYAKIKTEISHGRFLEDIVGLEKFIQEHIVILDLEKIEKLLKPQGVLRDSEIVLFLGETGTGKSTSILYLCGSELEKIGGEKYKFNGNQYGIQNLKELIIIGNGGESQTDTITVIDISKEQLSKILNKSVSKTITFGDVPGFCDSRGAEIDIVNCTALIDNIKTAKSIKLIYLISKNRTGDKSEFIFEVTKILNDLIHDISDDILKSILFLFTKFDRKENEDFMENLKQKREILEKTKKEKELIVLNRILDQFDGSQNTSDYFIDPTDVQSRNSVLRQIMSLSPIQRPKIEQTFKYFIKQESNAFPKLIKKIEFLKRQIMCAIEDHNNPLKICDEFDLSLISDAYEQIKFIKEKINLTNFEEVRNKLYDIEKEFDSKVERIFSNQIETFQNSLDKLNIKIVQQFRKEYRNACLFNKIYEKYSKKISSFDRFHTLVNNFVKKLLNKLDTFDVEDENLGKNLFDATIIYVNFLKFEENETKFEKIPPLTKYTDKAQNLFKELGKKATVNLENNEFSLFMADYSKVMKISENLSQVLENMAPYLENLKKKFNDKLNDISKSISNILYRFKSLDPVEPSDYDSLKNFFELIESLKLGSDFTNINKDKATIKKIYSETCTNIKIFFLNVKEMVDKADSLASNKNNMKTELKNIEKLMERLDFLRGIIQKSKECQEIINIYMEIKSILKGKIDGIQNELTRKFKAFNPSLSAFEFKALAKLIINFQNLNWLQKYMKIDQQNIIEEIQEDIEYTITHDLPEKMRNYDNSDSLERFFEAYNHIINMGSAFKGISEELSKKIDTSIEDANKLFEGKLNEFLPSLSENNLKINRLEDLKSMDRSLNFIEIYLTQGKDIKQKDREFLKKTKDNIISLITSFLKSKDEKISNFSEGILDQNLEECEKDVKEIAEVFETFESFETNYPNIKKICKDKEIKKISINKEKIIEDLRDAHEEISNQKSAANLKILAKLYSQLIPDEKFEFPKQIRAINNANKEEMDNCLKQEEYQKLNEMMKTNNARPFEQIKENYLSKTKSLCSLSLTIMKKLMNSTDSKMQEELRENLSKIKEISLNQQDNEIKTEINNFKESMKKCIDDFVKEFQSKLISYHELNANFKIYEFLTRIDQELALNCSPLSLSQKNIDFDFDFEAKTFLNPEYKDKYEGILHSFDLLELYQGNLKNFVTQSKADFATKLEQCFKNHLNEYRKESLEVFEKYSDELEIKIKNMPSVMKEKLLPMLEKFKNQKLQDSSEKRQKFDEIISKKQYDKLNSFVIEYHFKENNGCTSLFQNYAEREYKKMLDFRNNNVENFFEVIIKLWKFLSNLQKLENNPFEILINQVISDIKSILKETLKNISENLNNDELTQEKELQLSQKNFDFFLTMFMSNPEPNLDAMNYFIQSDLKINFEDFCEKLATKVKESKIFLEAILQSKDFKFLSDAKIKAFVAFLYRFEKVFAKTLKEKYKNLAEENKKLLASVNDHASHSNFKADLDNISKKIDQLGNSLMQMKQNLQTDHEINEWYSKINDFHCYYAEFCQFISSNYGKSLKNIEINLNEIIKQLIQEMKNLIENSIDSKKCGRFNFNLIQLQAIDKNCKGFDLSTELREIKTYVGNKIQERSDLANKNFDNIEEFSEILIELKIFEETIYAAKETAKKEIDLLLKNFKKTSNKNNLVLLHTSLTKNPNFMGNLLAKEHSVFKGLNNSLWASKIPKFELKDVLDSFEGDNVQKTKLDKLYREFKNHYESIVEENLKKMNNTDYSKIYEEIKKLITGKDIESEMAKFHENIKKNIASKKNNQISWPKSIVKIIPKLLGYVFALYTLSKSEDFFENKDHDRTYLWQPQTAQVLSIFRILCLDEEKEILCNNLAEIGTGEGKSIILATTSIIFSLLGFDVNCVCYSEYLSQRDHNEFHSFFKDLGVENYINYGTFQKLCEKTINDEYSDIRKYAVDLVLNKKNSLKKIAKNGRIRILLIDEVDVFFSKEFYGEVYTPEASVCHPEITSFIEMLYHSRNNNLTYANIVNTEQFKRVKLLFDQFSSLFEEESKTMFQDLKDFENHGYLVKDNKIVYKDQDRYVDNISMGYKTIFAYLYEIEKGNIRNTTETSKIMENFLSINIKCGEFSYAELPSKENFSFIFGVSGTLRTLDNFQKEILKTYDINKNTFVPSVYGKKENNLLFIQKEDVKVRASLTEYHMEISSEITSKLGSNDRKRAVIVIFEDEKKLLEFRDSRFFDNFRPDSHILTEQSNDFEKETIIKTAANEGMVTLITRAFGRGTDFISLSEKVMNNGGVHVLQTFFSKELSEEIQAKGRTCRQGQKGSYSLILLESELEYFQIYKQDIKDNEGKLYDFFNSKRNAKALIENETLKLGVELAKDKHIKSIEFLKCLIQGHLETILKYFLEFNKSNYVNKSLLLSLTILAIDATYSMSDLFAQLKITIGKTFEDAISVLKQANMPENCFSIQIVIYRNYNVNENDILEVSPWENTADNLRKFVDSVQVKGGWDNEAIELAFWHVNQELTKNKVSQVILIGDAAPNTKQEVLLKREDSQIDWNNTKFSNPTYYEDEMADIIANGTIINTFYLKDRNQASFANIAKKGKGECEFLDVNSFDGAQLLTDKLTKFIMKDVGQNAGVGDKLVKIHEEFIKKRKAYK